jgi:succinate dehydrogenase hydrophobic anchor subunit
MFPKQPLQAVVAIFSTICALAAVLSDLTVMEMSSVINIETVVATNFELVWKDSIASLGQVHNCYGYMNSYENVLKSFGIRDLLALTGLLIAFGWMSSAVNVFLEFSGTADLPSRLVNDAGRMSFVSACVIIALLFVRLTFYLLWAASNVTVFWMSVFSSGANPIFIMPHMPCLPAIGE